MSDDLNTAQIEEIGARLRDVHWRLANLYKIVTKDDDDEDGEGLVMTFKPNRAQRRLIARLHHRNIVLKARQLGFTTLVSILWLDTALFSTDPIRCGIIAHEREAAEAIFRDKVMFAYENLPEHVKALCPLRSRNKTEVVFDHNGASIKVSTSVRSGTIHRLHVSEFGKICAKYPAKAREVVTGSIPAVPQSGVTIIESTAEGQDGSFYDYTMQAMALVEKRATLTRKDYKLHFFAWWEAPEYSIDAPVEFTEAQMDYFTRVEARIGRTLSDGQRAWYVLTQRVDFADEAPLMWQEYPSYPEEAFQVSTEGCYYATQLAAARRAQRIRPDLPVERAPVWTFWDLGRGDMTALWLMQKIGPDYRFIGYYEETGEELDHYAEWLQKRGLTYAMHWLPHDANTKRLGESADTNLSHKEMLEKLMPGQRFDVVPRITNILSGIQQTREVLHACWFDEVACAVGLKRLQTYRKEWDKARGRWKDHPLHDDASHGSDAFRQFAQLVASGEKFGLGSFNRQTDEEFVSQARQRWRGRRGGSPMAA
jgi:hypothetical protein